MRLQPRSTKRSTGRSLQILPPTGLTGGGAPLTEALPEESCEEPQPVLVYKGSLRLEQGRAFQPHHDVDTHLPVKVGRHIEQTASACMFDFRGSKESVEAAMIEMPSSVVRPRQAVGTCGRLDLNGRPVESTGPGLKQSLEQLLIFHRSNVVFHPLELWSKAASLHQHILANRTVR